VPDLVKAFNCRPDEPMAAAGQCLNEAGALC
jgi:hypothetical protein